jgi:hypothetical protein
MPKFGTSGLASLARNSFGLHADVHNELAFAALDRLQQLGEPVGGFYRHSAGLASVFAAILVPPQTVER